MRRRPGRTVLLFAGVALAAAGCTASGGGGASSPAASPSSPAAPGSSTSVAASSGVAGSPPPAGTPTPTGSGRGTPTPPHSTPAGPSGATPQQAVNGLTVVLNPGHDGGNASHAAQIGRPVPAGYGEYKACDTTGTNTDAGYSEHAFNWDVALRVRTILQAHGVRVIMTRPNDTGVGPCVDQRAAIGNHSYVAAVVSIHADGAPSSGHGFHVNQDSRRPDGATAGVAQESDQLGQAIHAALVRSSGLVPSTYIGRDGYFYRTDLAGLDLATRPATFLELGNMRNAGDAALQSSAAGRQRIAAAVAAGILAYLAAAR